MCQWPQCHVAATDLHEIARGSHRDGALDQPCALLHLCREHHVQAHRRPSVIRDLAVKKLANDGTYDLKAVNLLRDRSPCAIEESEVDQYAIWIEGYFS